MQIVGILLVLLAGVSVLHLFSPKFTVFEKLGLGYILGLAFLTFGMIFLDVMHISINLVSCVLILIMVALPGLVIGKIDLFKSFDWDLDLLKKYGQNFSWLLCIGVIVYLLYIVGAKANYWPTLEYDSVTGYDLMGKAIAKEGKINNSLFQPSFNTRAFVRVLYPPYTSGSYTYAYLIGFKTPYIMVILHFISFLLVFYSFVSRVSGHYAAAFITMLCMVTPEFYTHAAMALTNLPNGIHTGIMMIALFLYMKSGENKFALVSMFVGFANTLTRTDALIFSLVGFSFMALNTLKTKNWQLLLAYLLVSILPFVVWNQYLSNVLHADSSSAYFVKHLFFDSDKIGKLYTYIHQYMIEDSNLYGISFTIFFIVLLVNLPKFKEFNNWFFLITFASWFGYTFLYYQMDNNVIDSLDVLMKASYKRGLFNFIPLVWFFIGTSYVSTWIFQKVEKFLYND